MSSLSEIRISLSPAAIAEVERLRRKQQCPEAALRVRVQSGGCAELYYDLSFEASPGSDDRCCTCDGVAIAVDVLSLPYVDGLTIDYTEDLMGGGFRFHNPHAERTCSCGHSFVPQADLTAH
ncbi:iron-sulfur cluster assembly accessory protein [Phormidium yuhuli AB48]|uniref:Iron-sulfur cluster assembly accessory protein n=1 Tax=Phormidium yuhuli AB48 TaxID=2940671 RepID=A0ABY5AQT9_9CYAN|nr:iron-sulfur cluster assembly accessory protein [Phormidium yuhuli]USR91592.1 iron-sulfur cluster assembly accessory protein [Phormidium yuhuli AB48]